MRDQNQIFMVKLNKSSPLKVIDSFWESDLSVLENEFIGQQDISELPVFTHNSVPYRGSVLLENSVYKKISHPNILLRVYARLLKQLK